MSVTTDRPVRVRFAPSPTGKLHIGGARTAIYNWAFARANDGAFILRIEDTDPTRSTEENVGIILRAMSWLGLDWDEGPGVEGDFGPYFQTQRTDTYEEALTYLKEHDAVYPCFCSKETLDAKRAAAEKDGGSYEGYDRACRDIDPAEAAARIAAGEPHVWRLKVPDDHGEVTFEDAVYGSMSFPIEVMDDMIVKRSDGTFTYNFAVVCDDMNMRISHVIRGDDHLSNTPRQVLIYEALGAEVPLFAHLPMILGADGHKLSKRHGATSVEQFRDDGYLADALVNFLALLGWSLDGETTIIKPEELCRAFGLDRINKKHSVFDQTKLDWMNGVYLREMDADAWIDAAAVWLSRAAETGRVVGSSAIVPASETSAAPGDGSETADVTADWEAVSDAALDYIAVDRELLRGIHPLIMERVNRLDELPGKISFFFWGPHTLLDEKSVNKVLRKDGARADEALRACRDVIAGFEPWEAEPMQEACRALCEPMDIKPKNLFQPLRVAVCGNMVSPPLFESIELMDRDDVLARIDAALELAFGE